MTKKKSQKEPAGRALGVVSPFELPDGHYCRGGNGFDVVGGKVRPSPVRVSDIEGIISEWVAAKLVMDQANRFAALALSHLRTRYRQVMLEVLADLGLEQQPEPQVQYKNGWVVPFEPPVDPKEG